MINPSFIKAWASVPFPTGHNPCFVSVASGELLFGSVSENICDVMVPPYHKNTRASELKGGG
jgi:hypothetical protein